MVWPLLCSGCTTILFFFVPVVDSAEYREGSLKNKLESQERENKTLVFENRKRWFRTFCVMDQRVNFNGAYNGPGCVVKVTKSLELDPKPDDLTLIRLKLLGEPAVEGRTPVCCIRLRRVEVRSDKLLESGDIWFSAKPMLVGRLGRRHR